MNPDNLRSLADLPPERRREIARMGGKASGIERTRRAQHFSCEHFVDLNKMFPGGVHLRDATKTYHLATIGKMVSHP